MNGHGTLEEGSCVCEDGWVGSGFREFPDAYCWTDAYDSYRSILLQECQDKCNNDVKCDLFTYSSGLRCGLYKKSVYGSGKKFLCDIRYSDSSDGISSSVFEKIDCKFSDETTCLNLVQHRMMGHVYV